MELDAVLVREIRPSVDAPAGASTAFDTAEATVTDWLDPAAAIAITANVKTAAVSARSSVRRDRRASLFGPGPPIRLLTSLYLDARAGHEPMPR